MSRTYTQTMEFIMKEVGRVKGVSLPVHASMLERAVRRHLPLRKLHPNPYDEFCNPEIGPNEGIVQRYAAAFRRMKENDAVSSVPLEPENRYMDPIYVQKITPEGYMILNGHHRWLAAVQSGMNRMPVRIVNLTQQKDLERMIAHAKNDKRVTMDLDEVVFTPGPDGGKEKALRFPLNRIYRQELRHGIPALISFLEQKGYDVWLYSAGYYSQDYVEKLLKHHGVKVTGVITGTARKGPKNAGTKEEAERLLRKTYQRTIHVDQNAILCVDHNGGTFSEIPLEEDGVWAAKIIDLVREGKADG
ncbi:MAG: ParB N-terminal domain-containing protein [Clostridia bacterium]|nr:ParB N-terminal domain-containing protein [Clostridia bacterium]